MNSLRRWWDAPLWAHAAAYLLVLLGLAATLRPDVPFTPDEGIYGTQVVALESGSWEYTPPSAELDPDGRFFPILHSSGEGEARFVYTRHPAYPSMLRGFRALGHGWLPVLLPGIVGAVVTAATAWAIAGRLAPGRERLAHWLVATSPVTFNALVLWGHAVAAAAAGLALVGLLRWLDAPRGAGRWLPVGLAVAAGALLRSEGQVFGAAIVGAAALVGLRRRRLAVLVGAGATAAVLVATYFLERSWVTAIGVGVAGSELGTREGGTVGSSGFLQGRYEGIRRSLLAGAIYRPGLGTLTLLAVLLVVVGVVWWQRRGAGPVVAALIGLGGALYTVRLAADLRDPIGGLLLAWPVVVVGIVAGLSATPVWLRRIRSAGPMFVVAVVAVLFVAGVGLTQYVDGGALQWGGRFFTPVVPLLAAGVAAAIGSSSGWVAGTAPRRFLLATAVVPALASVACLGVIRSQHERIHELVRAQGTAVQIALPKFLPAVMWRAVDLAWLVPPLSQYASPEDASRAALDLLEEGGVTDATLVWVDGFGLDTAGWTRTEVGTVRYDTVDLTVYRLHRPD